MIIIVISLAGANVVQIDRRVGLQREWFSEIRRALPNPRSPYASPSTSHYASATTLTVASASADLLNAQLAYRHVRGDEWGSEVCLSFRPSVYLQGFVALPSACAPFFGANLHLTWPLTSPLCLLLLLLFWHTNKYHLLMNL